MLNEFSQGEFNDLRFIQTAMILTVGYLHHSLSKKFLNKVDSQADVKTYIIDLNKFNVNFQNSEDKWFLRTDFDVDEVNGLYEYSYAEIKYCPYCGRSL